MSSHLILSLIILLSVGVLKLIISALGRQKSVRKVSLRIQIGDKSEELDAMVDSGNLAHDPLSDTPVMLLEKSLFVKLFGSEVLDGQVHSVETKRRLRVIPVCYGGVNKIFYAMRADRVTVLLEKRKEEISVLIASDGRDGYGGYTALMPLCALEGIV